MATNTSICAQLTAGKDYSCPIVPDVSKYYQQIVIMNANDIDPTTIVYPTTNGTTTFGVTFKLKAGKVGIKISDSNSSRAIFGKYDGKRDEMGKMKYSHIVNLLTSGISHADKIRLSQLGNGLFIVACQALDNTVEIYGFENGLQLADYTHDITATSGTTLLVLNSSEKSMESKLPYNYVSADPVANFDNGFIA
jgi:hypothetical protein